MRFGKFEIYPFYVKLIVKYFMLFLFIGYLLKLKIHFGTYLMPIHII